MIPVDTGRKLNVRKTFNLCPVSTMIKTYSQMHRTDKYSQDSSIIKDQFD